MQLRWCCVACRRYLSRGCWISPQTTSTKGSMFVVKCGSTKHLLLLVSCRQKNPPQKHPAQLHESACFVSEWSASIVPGRVQCPHWLNSGVFCIATRVDTACGDLTIGKPCCWGAMRSNLTHSFIAVQSYGHEWNQRVMPNQTSERCSFNHVINNVLSVDCLPFAVKICMKCRLLETGKERDFLGRISKCLTKTCVCLMPCPGLGTEYPARGLFWRCCVWWRLWSFLRCADWYLVLCWSCWHWDRGRGAGSATWALIIGSRVKWCRYASMAVVYWEQAHVNGAGAGCACMCAYTTVSPQGLWR